MKNLPAVLIRQRYSGAVDFLHEAPRGGRALLPGALHGSTDRGDRGGTGATASAFSSVRMHVLAV